MRTSYHPAQRTRRRSSTCIDSPESTQSKRRSIRNSISRPTTDTARFNPTSREQTSLFLALPTELRLQIYEHAIFDASEITIGTVEIWDAPVGRHITGIEGLPGNVVPVIRRRFDPKLLNITEGYGITQDEAIGRDIIDCMGDCKIGVPLAAASSIMATCRSMRVELQAHLEHTRRRSAYASQISEEASRRLESRASIRNTASSFSSSTSSQAGAKSSSPSQSHRASRSSSPMLDTPSSGLALHIAYPYGLLVMKHVCPHLLLQASTVHVTGAYTTPPFADTKHPRRNLALPLDHCTPSRRLASRRGSAPPREDLYLRGPLSTALTQERLRQRINDRLQEDSVLSATCYDTLPTLAQLIRTIFHPSRDASLLHSMTLRMFYPNESSYGAVWAEDNSPVVSVLHSIPGGSIVMDCYRGRLGTGVVISARPKLSGRVISSVWKRLAETWEGVEAWMLDGREGDGHDQDK